MSYAKAMQAAGAEVIEFECFGSYQGEWWAKVRYEGRIGWVQGSYGSCSGCDAFEGEFGFAYMDCEEHRWDHKDDCTACQEAKRQYDKRLADFGRLYLDELIPQEKAEEVAARNIEWDSEAQGMLDWLKSHALTANVVSPSE